MMCILLFRLTVLHFPRPPGGFPVGVGMPALNEVSEHDTQHQETACRLEDPQGCRSAVLSRAYMEVDGSREVSSMQS